MTLADKQHGFRRRCSCDIAAIEGIASKLQTGKDQVDFILFDFAKAFDKVRHVRMLHKLNDCVIHGELLPGSKNS